MSPDKVRERRPMTSNNFYNCDIDIDKLSENEEPRIMIEPASDMSGMPFTNSSIQ